MYERGAGGCFGKSLAFAYLPLELQILFLASDITQGRSCFRFLDSLGWQCESWLCYIPDHVSYFRGSQAPVLPFPLPKWLVLSIWETRGKPQGKGTSLDVVFRNWNVFFLSPVLPWPTMGISHFIHEKWHRCGTSVHQLSHFESLK